MARPVLSLVVPVRDEESGLPDLHTRLLDLLSKVGQEAEVVFVNDGSTDLTSQVLRGLAATEPRYRILGLSRSFGPAAAVAAGLAYARGQAVVALPPDLVPRSDLVFEMAQKWRDGYDVVHLRARPRKGGLGGLLRRIAQAMLPADAPLEEGAARLMSRRAVVAMRALGESHRFVRGVVAWIGFRQTELEYDPEGFPPKLGATWRLAWGALTAYSTVPLRLATYFGFGLGAFALFLGIVSLIVVAAGSTLPGWFAGAIIAALFTSAQLVAIGILGDYVGKVYEEVKRRPLYVVSERVNLFAPDDDIVEEVAPPPPPVIDAKASVPPAATLMGMPAPNLPAPHPPAPNVPATTAPMPTIPKTAPMAQVPPPPAFPSPNALPAAQVSATAPTAPASSPQPVAGRTSSSIKTAPVTTVKPETTPTSIPTAKPGTLEVPTVPQPSAEAPTVRDAPTQESAAPRSSTLSYPPPSRSSAPPPPAPSSGKSKPPPIPKRAKKEP